jgi:O-antigen/teichoic acid export membrane protein
MAVNIAAAVVVSDLVLAFGLIALELIPLFLSLVPLSVLYGLVYNELAGDLMLVYDIFIWGGVFTLDLMGGSIVDLGWWLLLINIGDFGLTSIAALWVLRPFNLRFVLDVPLYKELVHYGFYAWIISIGGHFYQQVDRIVVGIVLGAVVAGVYGIATGIAFRLTMLATEFSQVLLPFASSYQVKDRLQEIRTTFRNASRLVVCLITLASSVLVIWMDYILDLWISPQFSHNYAQAFRILMIIYAVHSVVLPALLSHEANSSRPECYPARNHGAGDTLGYGTA